jgi:hypothetical protein
MKRISIARLMQALVGATVTDGIMTLADHPNSRYSASSNRPLAAMPAAPKRSWLDVLLARPEPDPPPAPLPPRARPVKDRAPTDASAVEVDRATPGAEVRPAPPAPLTTPLARPSIALALRNDGPPPHFRPKPPAYVTDLLVMSTLDQKEPPTAPGAGDLLDTLVQDHLQRASAPREGASPDRLQQEIAALLAGEPLAEAPVEPGAPPGDGGQDAALTKDPFADFPTAAPPIVQVPPGDRSTPHASNVSSAELEVLLKDMIEHPDSVKATADGGLLELAAAEAERAQPSLATVAAPAPAPTQIDQLTELVAGDEVSSKLTEADGVMAEELAQLMAEKPSAPIPASAAGAAAGKAGPATSPVPAELAAAVQSIMANPVQLADQKSAAPIAEPVAATQSIQPLAHPGATVLDAPADVPVQQDHAASVAASLDTLAALTPRPLEPSAKPHILARMWYFVRDVIIMVLQVIDMPFGWIKEPDKNVMGMAALLLLLSGALLIWVARMIGY